eukprot:CAMPEP_0175075724 /NCGR_PEP_ID=MMETSP0052_2-20121109/22219_1 /TAXON_ID=51329 ORGANISM="Polytomella parva, Strain SAG 63-3" /NCGR_SAMPLE_ID=MMETSP0052_2 /ASSEMBLY_ACC=CAM_ASM_000194 /LENGTH=106 /DNA_ID=CAMNT_0016344561 /DNA_START=15 /DNA_END=333 /DNA_ORIENTATION=+
MGSLRKLICLSAGRCAPQHWQCQDELIRSAEVKADKHRSKVTSGKGGKEDEGFGGRFVFFAGLFGEKVGGEEAGVGGKEEDEEKQEKQEKQAKREKKEKKEEEEKE